MNAPAHATPAGKLADAQSALAIKANIRAFLWWEYQFADMPEAVDPLQEFAERSGLVAALGQDAVQAIIAEPFLRFRTLPDEDEPAVAELALEHELSEFDRLEIARRIERWEAEDAKRPRAPERPAKAKRPASSTVAAFKYVLGLGDADHLARWLHEHQDDAPALLQIAGSSK